MSVTESLVNEPDQDDRINPTGLGGGPTGTPGRPCGYGESVVLPAGTSTANQPKPTPPAGSSTANQPRPEDFM